MNDTKKSKKDSKYFILIILAILVLILLVVGVSFAAVFYSKTGEEINRVSTGTITMSYSEKTNGIDITDAYPMTDELGMQLSGEDQYFDFTVSATVGGNVLLNYSITATKEYSTLPDNAVKVYLTNTNNINNEVAVLAPKKVSELSITNNDLSGAPDNQYILASGTFSETTVNNYRLRMWVANDYVLPLEVQTYALRVNVYGSLAV